ncbi:MAG: peptidoglycan DD-metalloendopeptidase family protein [Acidimicrobiia bacterium]|nr:peptidoglycan DD-metalloendopeptidase family protein [Acidimicrobiia bacterium]
MVAGTSSRRHLLIWLLLVAVLATVIPAATAQTDAIDATRDEREALRREKAEQAAQLDPLLAQDLELEQAVADLDALIQLQEAKLDATRQAIVAAEAAVAAAEARVAQMQATIADLRELARLQAIEAYVKPNGDVVQQVLTAADLTTAARRRALLRSVNTSQADLLDQLRAAEEDLADAEADAEAALADVESRRDDEEGQLADIESTRVDQLRLKSALEERIAEFHAEIDALAAEEDELTARLTSLIAQEEARIRAEEEARRRAEQERLLAEQTQVPDDSGAGPQPTPELPDPLPAPESATGLIWPANGIVTSPFGLRWGRIHRGIDINAPAGSPIVAAKAGSVVFAGDNGGFGLNVIIDHGGGFATVYAHLSSISVSEGQSVGQGQSLGGSGCTGSCTGDHLHFETRVNGVAQDPMLFLS